MKRVGLILAATLAFAGCGPRHLTAQEQARQRAQEARQIAQERKAEAAGRARDRARAQAVAKRDAAQREKTREAAAVAALERQITPDMWATIKLGEPKDIIRQFYPHLVIKSDDWRSLIPASIGGVYVLTWKPQCFSNGSYNCAADTLQSKGYYNNEG